MTPQPLLDVLWQHNVRLIQSQKRRRYSDLFRTDSQILDGPGNFAVDAGNLPVQQTHEAQQLTHSNGRLADIPRRQTRVQGQRCTRPELRGKPASQGNRPTLWVMPVRMDMKRPFTPDVSGKLPHEIQRARYLD